MTAHKDVDFEILQESALAMAQATIQNALTDSGMSRADLAKNMDRPRSFVTRMMSGSHNLTVKTLALALAASGFEIKFDYTPLNWGWAAADITPIVTNNVSVSTEGGHVRASSARGGMDVPAFARAV